MFECLYCNNSYKSALSLKEHPAFHFIKLVQTVLLHYLMYCHPFALHFFICLSIITCFCLTYLEGPEFLN